MLKFSYSAIALSAVLLSGVSIAGPALAMSGEASPARAESFYAYAGETASQTAQSSKCFSTNSATERTRGIRHWQNCE